VSCFAFAGAIVSITPDFAPGDPAPSGYIDRAEWARVQLGAGLRQARCNTCGLLHFPQEQVRCRKEARP